MSINRAVKIVFHLIACRMAKTKKTSHKHRPEPNPFLTEQEEADLSSAMEEHVIATSPPTSLDDAQPALPTKDVDEPKTQEIVKDPHRSKEPSPIDEDRELEDMEEDEAAVEADEDLLTKLGKKNKKKKKEKKHPKSKTLEVK